MSISDTIIEPTAYQSTVLAIPESINLFLGGGRAGGKTFSAGLDQVRHVEKYGERARPLIIRESHKGIEEITETLNTLYHAAYKGMHTINRNKGQIRLPNGAIVTLGILDGPDSWRQWATRRRCRRKGYRSGNGWPGRWWSRQDLQSLWRRAGLPQVQLPWQHWGCPQWRRVWLIPRAWRLGFA